MKIFGRGLENSERIISLKEVTLYLTTKEIEALADFSKKCAKEASEEMDWEHGHFSDGFPEIEGVAELVVFVDRSDRNLQGQLPHSSVISDHFPKS